MRPARHLAMVIAASILLIAFAAPSAMASQTISGSTFFGAVGTTGGQLASGGGGVGGIAVNDSSGHVYVADRGNNRIQVFDEEGKFLRAWGRDVTESGPGNTGADEQQSITVRATGGTFRLIFNAYETAPLPYNASAAKVRSALNGLPSISAQGGGVTVTGGPGDETGSSPYLVTFSGGNLTGFNVAELASDASALTGGSPSSAAAVATTVSGGTGGTLPELCIAGEYCKAGTTAGQTAGSLSAPQGVAVDQSSGNVYVADQGFLRVDVFGKNGNFLRAFGQDVVSSGPGNTGGYEICVAANGDVCKTGASGTTGGAFASTFAGHPAVVPPGAPNAGNVLLADPGNRRVQEFTPAGTFVRAFGFDTIALGQPNDTGADFEECTVIAECQAGTAGNDVGQFATNEPKRLAVDAVGSIYTVESSANFRVQKLVAGVTLTPEVFSSAALSGAGSTTTPTDVAVDRASGQVYVVKANASPAERRVLQLSSAGALLDTHMAGAAINSVNGLAVDTSGDTIYVSSSSPEQHVYPLRDATAPSFTGVSMARNDQTSAQLNARVNPRGSAVESCAFEYGTTNAYGQSVPCLIDAIAEATFVGSSGITEIPIAAKLSGLAEATTYHYRLVVEGAAGTTASDDLTFKTASAPKECPTCAGVGGERRIELVSDIDKNRNTISATKPSADGNRVLYTVLGSSKSPFSAGLVFAERTSSGWISRNALPANDGSFANGTGFHMRFASPDLSTMLVEHSTQFFSNPSRYFLTRLHDDGTLEETLHTFPENHTDVPTMVATPDVSRVFYLTRELLDPDHIVAETFNLYDLSSSPPELISRLPDGTVPACGVPKSNVPNGFSTTANRSHHSQRWLSEDASFLFFQAVRSGPCTGGQAAMQLYRRDLVAGTTTLISGPVVSGADTGLAQPGLVQAADDGSWVIYKSRARLDPDDDDATPDAYRWEAATEVNTCLTCGATAAANIPNAAERTGHASEDGSRVYFPSNGQLTPEAPATGLKLYVWSDAGGGTVRYITPFPNANIAPSLNQGSDLNPTGDVLLFTVGSAGATADRQTSGQYYRYDDRDGAVACISCPAGPAAHDVDSFLTPLSSMEAQLSHQHTLSADGSTIVFESKEALVSADDLNDDGDIYEWRDGRLGLVTDGVSEQGEFLVSGGLLRDAENPGGPRDGRDLIFVARGDPSLGARDHSPQLYDARLGGGFTAVPAPPAPCAGEGCLGGPGSPPVAPGAVTPSFSGPGNPAPRRLKKRCAKGKRVVRRHGKARCVSKRKRANHNRRPSR